MLIAGKHLQTIWFDESSESVKIIDQTRLPHTLEIVSLVSLADAATAISAMQVRGAPLIGVTAAYGLYLALREDPTVLEQSLQQLAATRPTAINLRWALERCQRHLQTLSPENRAAEALALARSMEREDIDVCSAIGDHSAELLDELWQTKKSTQDRLNVLTHCNAGALATVDWGTALAGIYKAVNRDIPIHVWVDETRPRNQGAALTCWELGQQDIAHTLIVDNAGGHLMRQGLVDVCLVGSDRTTSNGDVCNKIGTYLKALAAHDNRVPFYVALPMSTIDYSLASGDAIPIEERAGAEVSHVHGRNAEGVHTAVSIAPVGTAVSNPGFDVTPARLISGLITERGVCAANSEALAALRLTSSNAT